MDDAAHLHFSDLKDVDDFIAGLAKYEAGEWHAEQFRMFRLARGTYGQRQADSSMVRVKMPQGILRSEQLEALATVAEVHARGFCHLTTRQNVQYHFLKLADVPAVLTTLAEVGLTTKEACGNTVRNVTGCAMAGVCGGESFDVTPYAQEVTRHFLRRPENQALPRKFKIAFSGCEDDCAFGAINDVACIARVENGVRGFRVKVAGGLSTTPEDAHVLYDFLPVERLVAVIEAVIAVFDRLGNRQNKARARMKYIVRKLGWDGYRKAFEEELGKIAVLDRPIDTAGGDSLSRPPVRLRLHRDADPDGLAGFRRANVVRQRQRGFVAVTVRLVRGDITGAQLRGLADLARRFGDGMVRATLDQNLLLRFVSDEQLGELYRGLALLGLATPDAGTIYDVTSCPGADSCNLAVTASRELASSLTSRLEATPALAETARDVSIKISGCPNSCGQHHIAGIGFHGGMRRVGGKVVPEYTLHLGGGIDAGGAKFGRAIVKLPARRVSEALVRLLGAYVEKRHDGEKALAFFRRLPDDQLKSLVADLVRVDEDAPAQDFLDNGSDQTFVAATGPGECAA